MSTVAADLLGQLRQAFGTALFEAGERLADAQGVHDVRILQAGRIVTGVAVPAPPAGKCRVYVQYTVAETRQIAGECSCGQSGHCVHVAAVCIAAARQVHATDRAPAGTTSARSDSTAHTGASREQRLCYRIEPPLATDDPALRLSLWIGQPEVISGRIQPDATRFDLRSCAAEGSFPRYVDAADHAIIKALAALPQAANHEWLLRAQLGELLPRIVATGRAFWCSFTGRALTFGTPRPLLVRWQVNSDGSQQLSHELPGSVTLFSGSRPPAYFDAEQGTCGWLEPQGGASLLQRYWRVRIAPESVAAVNAELAGAMPALRTLVLQRRRVGQVRGRLHLRSQPEAELQFLYDELPIEHALPASVRAMPDSQGDVVYEFERDHAHEQQLQAQLQRAQPAGSTSTTAHWLQFMVEGIPRLQAQGWDVQIAANFPYRVVQAQQWYAELEAEPQQARARDREGWFDLRLGVTLGDEYCNLLPVLVSYLQSAGQGVAATDSHCKVGDQLLMRLEDGRYLPVPMARIERIAETLVELLEGSSLNRRHALSLPASQAGRLALLREDLSQVRCADDGLRRVIEGLQSSAITPLPAPAGFQAMLRPYQQEGLGWLQFLRRCGLGGLLADDMGLGKTLQTLAHLLLEKRSGQHKPSLVVAPVSVIGNWQRELQRFAPELRCVVLHGNRRREAFAAVGAADVVVTGYPQLQLDSDFLLSCEFKLVVLDEAQMIKNPRTRAAQVARELRAEQRLCLSGTPMENHLGELWSLFDFLQPGMLGDQQQFQRLYRTPIEKEGNVQRAAALSRRLAPFMLRRTKDAVAADLPEKTQIIESVVLDEQQRDFYDAIRLAMHQRVQEAIAQQGLARSHITMLDALLKLRQACCDPRLVDIDLGPDVARPAAIPSAKLQWLMTVLPELAAEGRRVLLFSQFTSMLALIEAAVRELAIPYCLLTGATRERSSLVERFQSGTVPLFLISLKAGGTGLNLSAADTVIHYDPWWNPAVEAQATDRAHRIGQRRPVFVYKLIAQDTVEEKILRLQADKHALANQLYTDQAAPSQLTAAELTELLAP